MRIVIHKYLLFHNNNINNIIDKEIKRIRKGFLLEYFWDVSILLNIHKYIYNVYKFYVYISSDITDKFIKTRFNIDYNNNIMTVMMYINYSKNLDIWNYNYREISYVITFTSKNYKYMTSIFRNEFYIDWDPLDSDHVNHQKKYATFDDLNNNKIMINEIYDNGILAHKY